MRVSILLLCLVCAVPAQAQSTVSLSAYPDHMVGRRTSSGEIYNPHGLTVAHPSLPFGTMLELTASDTGRSVMVEVTDRGLMLGESELIVSPAALDRLGLDDADSPTVSVRHWREGRRPSAGPALATTDERATTGRATAEPVAEAAAPPTSPRREAPRGESTQPSAAERTAPTSTTVPARSSSVPALFAIQMGSFSDRSAAVSLAGTLDGAWIKSATVNGKTVHRVFFGRFNQRNDAEGWQARLRGLGVEGYVRAVPD